MVHQTIIGFNIHWTGSFFWITHCLLLSRQNQEGILIKMDVTLPDQQNQIITA